MSKPRWLDEQPEINRKYPKSKPKKLIRMAESALYQSLEVYN